MTKKIVGVFLGMVLSSVLYADNYSEGQKFIGLEVGAAEIQGGVYLDPFLDPLNNVTYDNFYEGSDVTFGVRFGAQNDNYRTTILFDYYNNEDEDQSFQLGLATLDYFVLSQDAASMTVKPYVGLNVGYMRYEATWVDETGFMYGGQAGIVANVAENIDIDLSYRYSWSYDAVSMDHFAAAMLGINYLY